MDFPVSFVVVPTAPETYELPSSSSSSEEDEDPLAFAGGPFRPIQPRPPLPSPPRLSDSTLVCPSCFARFPDNADLVQHVANANSCFARLCNPRGAAHPDPLRSFRYAFAVRPDEDDGWTFACEACGTAFAGKASLTRHRYRRCFKLRADDETDDKDDKDGCRSEPSDAKDDAVGANIPAIGQQTVDRDRQDVPFKCDFCAVKFYDEQSFKRHVENRRSEPSDLKCDVCSQVFATNAARTEHVAREHAGVDVQFKCDFCAVKFYDEQSFKRHVENRRSEPSDLKCDVCSQVFATNAARTEHVAREHAGVDVQFKCDFCAVKFPDIASRNLHLHFLCVGKQ